LDFARLTKGQEPRYRTYAMVFNEVDTAKPREEVREFVVCHSLEIPLRGLLKRGSASRDTSGLLDVVTYIY
jgi:hypothetical protein